MFSFFSGLGIDKDISLEHNMKKFTLFSDICLKLDIVVITIQGNSVSSKGTGGFIHAADR